MSAQWKDALDAAVGAGLGPNFSRWLGFSGASAGEWIELQALGVRTPYGERVRFAHACAKNKARLEPRDQQRENDQSTQCAGRHGNRNQNTFHM